MATDKTSARTETDKGWTVTRAPRRYITGSDTNTTATVRHEYESDSQTRMRHLLEPVNRGLVVARAEKLHVRRARGQQVFAAELHVRLGTRHVPYTRRVVS